MNPRKFKFADKTKALFNRLAVPGVFAIFVILLCIGGLAIAKCL